MTSAQYQIRLNDKEDKDFLLAWSEADHFVLEITSHRLDLSKNDTPVVTKELSVNLSSADAIALAEWLLFCAGPSANE